MKKWYISSILGLFVLLCQFSNVNAQSWKEMTDSCNFYQETGDYQTALAWAQKALSIAEKEYGKNDTNYISIVGTVSELYYYLGKLDSAIYYGDIRLSTCRRIFKEDHPKLADGINNMAIFYDDRGDYKQAEPLYIEAMEMRRRIFNGDHSDLAISISNVGLFYLERGDYKKAEPYYKESLEMYRRLFKDDYEVLIYSINNVATFYKVRGDYKQAEPLYKEALEICRRIYNGIHPSLASIINNMATFYTSIGDYKQAEPLLKEALEMRRSIFKGDHPDLAHSIANLALFYKARGNNKKALDLLKEALEMTTRIFRSDHPYIPESLNNLANFYNSIGDYNQAEALYKKALDMTIRLFKTTQPSSIKTIISLANIHNARGDYKQVDSFYLEAYNMTFEILNSKNLYSAISYNLMECFYDGRGDYKQAEPLFRKALDTFKIKYRDKQNDLVVGINNMAIFYENRGDYKQAEPLYIDVLDQYKNMLNDYFPSLSENGKKLFWNTVSDYFEAFNSFAVNRYYENPSIACNMYDIQLYTKALLFNSTSKVKKRIINSNDSVLIDRYKDLTDNKELLVKLYAMTENDRRKKGFDLDSIEKITNELEKELSLKSELYSKGYDKKKVTWKSIIPLLEPDEVAVEVIRFRHKEKNKFTDTVLYAFLIVNDKTEENPDLVVLENGNLLENEYYQSYRLMIKSKITDTVSFRKYWGKLYEKLKGYKKVYFSSDGIYNKLNPATLLMPDGKYLLEVQDIQQVNSTKDLQSLYFQSKQESNIYNSAVLIGNPNFSLSESLVKKASLKIKVDTDDDKSYQQFSQIRGIDLKRLPGTDKEIKDIEKFLEARNWVVKSYLGDMALKTAVKSANSPRVLHIATHGLFLEDVNLENKETFGFETQKVVDNPLLRSGLFFTGADNYIKSDSAKPVGDENGLLTAYEAMNLDLDKTELVVLSACETGLGDIKNGEGVFGLRRAFQQAGAKTVIMSLWAVNDDATQKLMSSFYSNWVTGMTKREAFSNAQQEVRKQFPEPYFWGAFVMVGE